MSHNVIHTGILMSFSKKQIVQTSELTPRQVQFFTEQGVVSPDEDPGEGRGKVRRYSRRNLLDFLIIKNLQDWRITVSEIKTILKAIRSMRKVLLLDIFLEAEGTYLFIRRKSDGTIKISFKRINPWRLVDTGLEIGRSPERRKEKSVLSVESMKDFSSCMVMDLGSLAMKAARE